MLDLNELSNKLKLALKQETTESLTFWLENKRKNYEEDFKHENGNYENVCFKCKESFIGHKRRVICKECLNK